MKALRVAIAIALSLSALVVVLRLTGHPSPPAAHELLREVYSPRFGPVPPRPPAGDVLSRVWSDLRSPEGIAFLRRWLPSQSGTLWLALLVTVVVGFDLERPRHPRNLDLILMQVLGMVFFDILFFTRRLQDPYWLAVLWWVFDAVVVISVLIAVRAVWRVFRPFSEPWRPALRTRSLVAVALLMLALNVTAALVRDADDSGFFANLIWNDLLSSPRFLRWKTCCWSERVSLPT